MIGQTISHYKITEKLGGGGMGVVYKAEDTKLNRPVALKFIHPHLTSDEPLKKRFLREAQLASSLDHPNICNIYEIDEAPDGRLFFSMAYYDGESLADRAKRAPLPSREVFQICFSIAQGLSCAHRNGIIHRDIKPGNIIITEEGFIKIVDFGLAKLSEGSTRLTKTDTTVGTVRYMSPEQATDKDVDHRSDIWSLGVILHELATGKSPFRGEIDAAIFYSILHDDPTPVNEINSSIPEACAQIITRCLEKDVEKRYQSVDELLEDMGTLARELGWGSSIAGLTVPAVGPGYYRRPGHRLRTAAGIIAVAIVIGALITWWQMREASLYTTDIRLAVMPLVNKTHPDNNTYVTGLTEIVYDMLDYASMQNESMWVVPNRLVRYAKLADYADAREAFGINRIITGAVQRFSNKQLLLLELRNAKTLDRIRSESIPFDIDTPSPLADSLSAAIIRLLNIDKIKDVSIAKFMPTEVSAIKPYLDGVGDLQERNIDAAIASLEMMYSQDPDFAAGRTVLGWAYWAKYQETNEESLLEQSIDYLKAVSQIEPAFWQPGYKLGEIYRNTNNIDSAIVYYQSVIKKDPGNLLACRRLPYIYHDQKRYNEAEHMLLSAINKRPDYFESHRLLAKYFYDSKQEDEAIQKLNKTIALAPNDAYSLNMLGIIYHHRGEYTKARKLLELAFQLLPMCDTCCNVGLILFFEKRYKDSASYYELALEYCGDGEYDVWGGWASSLYWVEGERDKSIELYKKAIELATQELKTQPDDPSLIACLIEYYASIADTNKTTEMIAYAKSLVLDDKRVLYAIGDAYELLGDRTAALRYLGDAIRHGFPVSEIEATPELADLIREPVFKQISSDKEQWDPSVQGSSK